MKLEYSAWIKLNLYGEVSFTINAGKYPKLVIKIIINNLEIHF